MSRLAADRPSPPAPATAGRPRLLVAAVVLVVVLGGGAAYLATRLASDAGGATHALRSAGRTSHATFGTYRDPQGRFTVRTPAGWRLLPSRDPGVAALFDIHGLDSMLVRVIPLGRRLTTADDVAAMRRLTDAMIDAGHVHVLARRSIMLAGSPGFYYLYRTAASGQVPAGLHAHYFLFHGATLHVLVFQATPASDFTALASTFDAVARSYRPLR